MKLVAPDGAALTGENNDNDAEPDDDFAWYLNSQNHQMIVAYNDDNNNDGQHLFSSMDDNGLFMPFVPVSHPLGDGNTPGDTQVRCVWLNTRNHADPVARSRHGDAVIVMTQRLQADPAEGSDDDETLALVCVYFDVSRRGSAQSFVTDSVTGETVHTNEHA